MPIIGNKGTKAVTFSLVLSAPTNAVIYKSTGKCTIDPPTAVPKPGAAAPTDTSKGAAVTAGMSEALLLEIANASQPTAASQKTAAVDAAIAQLEGVK